MKHLDEYRDAARVRGLAAELRRVAKRPWRIMEICGGQTHAILRFGVDQLLPPGLELVHGPGCPVCVTPLELIDKAIELAFRPGVVLASFGDMLRVPGSRTDLLSARARGARVAAVYSPLDAVRLAEMRPDEHVVFFAVGFETTAPGVALALKRARQALIFNFSILAAHVLVPPALRAILGAPGNRIQGLLAAGHVCTVEGYVDYEPIAREFRVPIVVTGFEPADLMLGLLMCVRQLEQDRAEVENQYARAVRREGNPAARALVREIFEPCDRNWRGIGRIPMSGLRLRREWAEFDAEQRFPLETGQVQESALCISGLVLQGAKRPVECPAFGRECTPDHPLGAPMVSSEGACAAYYRYGRQHV
ncbi:MAG: hydrogenase formation protein HypD [Bryobacteraceae bacterium]|nr:hydrogenase formation protein HypD [Bryobacteraceae bacterium]